MKVFVWNYVSQCTNNYHSGGGVVVFAETEERARELANAKDGCRINTDEKPDHVRSVRGGGEMVYLFPDVGCC